MPHDGWSHKARSGNFHNWRCSDQPKGVSWIYTSEHAPPNGMTAADSYFQPVRGIVLFILGDLMTMRSAIRRSRCLVRSAPTFGVPKAEYAKLDSLIRAAHFQNP